MALTANLVEISLMAGADLSASQYRAVKISADDTVVRAAAAGEACIGIVTNNPQSGQVASVAIGGRVKAKAGGAISAGAFVCAAADGRVIAATAAPASEVSVLAAADALVGSFVLGTAMTDAAEDDLVAILWTPQGAIPTTAA